MFSISLQRDGHVRHYSVCTSPSSGWEVRLEADREVSRHAIYRDWHRVERACAVFALEVSYLTAGGWQVVGNESSSGQQKSDQEGQSTKR